MAKGGGKKRTYVRDGNGRFASTPGGGKPALKGGTLTKRSSLKNSRAKLKAKDAADPSIRNTLSTRSQKGAVTRGNKALRAAKVASQRTAVGRSKVGTISKAKRSPVLKATVLKPEARVPASQRPGSMTSILRATMGALAKADARRIREIEAITGQKVRPAATGAKAGKEAGTRVRATAKKGKVADTLRAGLRELAQSDARTMRGMAEIVRDATPKVGGGKAGKAMRGGRAALPAGKPTKLAASNRPKRELAARVARADKVDNKLKAQLKQAKASGNLKKEYETISRMQRVDRFNQTYNFADLKASRRALTLAKPTAPRRTRSARTPSTVAKPKGLKPSPVNRAAAKPMKAAVQFRSRKQAASAQKERNRRLYEFAASAPGASIDIAISPGERSMKRKATKVSQGNLLTGRVDSVKANEKITFGRSRIGRSAISKKNEQRRSRAEARYETLLQERKAIMRRGRVKGGELATNTQRMAAVSGAFRVYDMGTGRKPKRKSTGRQRARNLGDLN